MVSDRGLQFAAGLTKKLNRMLGIKTKLSIAFHSQTDRQTEHINQKLEQYLQFFVNHRQKNWPEQLASAEFAVNNKVHSTTKVSLFMANYGRELRIERDIRRKEKVEKAIEFVEKLKMVQEEVGAVLKRMQEEMKIYADQNRKKIEEQKKEDRVMLISQIRYSLVVILELNGGSEVQYKDMMMIDDGKYQ